MALKKKPGELPIIEILTPEQGRLGIAVLGTTPFICNRQSEKVKRELLLPARKSRATREQSLKHNPVEEYQASPYTLSNSQAPTLLAVLATAFKKAMMTAALDTPGANKTQIGRLVRVEGERVPLYGVPKLYMSVTRDASIKRTPDVRTRAMVPAWACMLEVTFPASIIKGVSIFNLMNAAGMFSGVGDWRTEKGSGNYGSFKVVNPDDEDFQEILRTGGRAAQEKAMEDPVPYDDESADLLAWWESEAQSRGFKLAG